MSNASVTTVHFKMILRLQCYQLLLRNWVRVLKKPHVSQSPNMMGCVSMPFPLGLQRKPEYCSLVHATAAGSMALLEMCNGLVILHEIWINV